MQLYITIVSSLCTNMKKLVLFSTLLVVVLCALLGEACPPGPPGIMGLQGERGFRGFNGSQGIQGVPGSTGGDGPRGPQGIQGNQGIQGIKGDQGIQGLQGINGTKGDKGDQGIQGIQGIPGNTGQQGIQGVQGLPGIAGPKGNNGSQGIQGIQGIQGVAGQMGNQGNPGSTGQQGIQGIQGEQGVQGNRGPQGNPGTNGTVGPPGPAGVVNYVNWLDNGTYFAQTQAKAKTVTNGIIIQLVTKDIRTHAQQIAGAPCGLKNNLTDFVIVVEWLGGNSFTCAEVGDVAGVQGPPGPQGIQGNQGLQGIPGSTGSQGIPGTQGIQGVQGKQGNNGTRGPQGPQGTQGVAGNTGSQGPPGPTNPSSDGAGSVGQRNLRWGEVYALNGAFNNSVISGTITANFVSSIGGISVSGAGSVSPTTGSVLVNGGVGVTGNVYASGTIQANTGLNSQGPITATGLGTFGQITTAGNIQTTGTGTIESNGGGGSQNGWNVAGAALTTSAGLFVTSGTTALTSTTVTGTLSTSALATLNSAVVNNALTVGTTLGVTGLSTFAAVNEGNTAITGTLGVSGISTLGVVNEGNTAITGTLSTSGLATLNSAAITNGATVGTTLQVSGITTLGIVNEGNTAITGTLSTSSVATLNSVAVTNGATVGTTLAVTGTSTFAAVNEGNTAITGTLGVSGISTFATVNEGNTAITGTLSTSGQVTATAATASTTTANGAVVVTGGVGIGGAINVGGLATVNGGLTVKVNNPITAQFIATSTTNNNASTVYISNINAANSGLKMAWDAVNGIQIQDGAFRQWLVQGGTTPFSVKTHSNTLDNGAGAMTVGGTLGVTGTSTLAAVNSGNHAVTGTLSSTGALTSAAHAITYSAATYGLSVSQSTTGDGSFAWFGNTVSTRSAQVGLDGTGFVGIQAGALTLATDSTGNLPIYLAPGYTTTYSLKASSGGVLNSFKNTLDDGTGVLKVASTATSTSTATGSLQVAGGAGIAGPLFSGAHTATSASAVVIAGITTTTTSNNQVGLQLSNSLISPSGLYMFWDTTHGVSIYDQKNAAYWLTQGGTTAGVVKTLNNQLDDGNGNMAILGTLTTPLQVQSSGTTQSLIEIVLAGTVSAYIGYTTTNGVVMYNGGGSPILYQSAATRTGLSLRTANNILDDGTTGSASILGVLTFTGNPSPTVGTAGSIIYNQAGVGMTVVGPKIQLTTNNGGNVQNIVALGGTLTTLNVNPVSITSTSASGSTVTGALQVAGGVGIGGALNVGTPSFISSSGAGNVLTLSQQAVTGSHGLSLIAASYAAPSTRTAINFAAGSTNVWEMGTDNTATGTANFYMYCATTSTTAFTITQSGVINMPATTASASATTGALTIGGGLGVGGIITLGGTTPTLQFGSASNSISAGSSGMTFTDNNLASLVISPTGTVTVAGSINVGGSTNVFTSTVGATSPSSASVVFDGGIGVAGISYFGSTVSATQFSGNTGTFASATASTSTSSGAVTIIGGLGVGGTIYAGGYVPNFLQFTTSGATLTQAQSGSIIGLGGNSCNAYTITLPTTPSLGSYYEFFFTGGSSCGAFTITCTTTNCIYASNIIAYYQTSESTGFFANPLPQSKKNFVYITNQAGGTVTFRYVGTNAWLLTGTIDYASTGFLSFS